MEKSRTNEEEDKIGGGGGAREIEEEVKRNINKKRGWGVRTRKNENEAVLEL